MTIPDVAHFSYTHMQRHQLCWSIMHCVPAFTISGYTIKLLQVHFEHVIGNNVDIAHVHSYYEAHVILDGSIIGVTAAKCQRISRAGSVLIAPQTLHSWKYDTPCWRLILCFEIAPGIAVPIPEQWPVRPEILREIHALLSDTERQAIGWRECVAGRITILIASLLTMAHLTTDDQPIGKPDDRQLFTIARTFMQDNLERPLKVADIASHLGMSERSLMRHFRDWTGNTVSNYLQQLRMELAAQLLVESDLSISVIGLQAGIPDTSYFCRCFQKHFLVSPQQYRKHPLPEK